MTSATIADKDMGMNDILKEIEEFKSSMVKVGILSSSGSVDGVAIVDYATWNEVGVHGKKGWKIPPRPFVRGWADAKKEEIIKCIDSLLSKVTSGKMTAKAAMNALGVFGKSGIQAYIANGDFQPNAPRTIKKKGSSRPLIDTGAMRQAVNFEVVK